MAWHSANLSVLDMSVCTVCHGVWCRVSEMLSGLFFFLFFFLMNPAFQHSVSEQAAFSWHTTAHTDCICSKPKHPRSCTHLHLLSHTLCLLECNHRNRAHAQWGLWWRQQKTGGGVFTSICPCCTSWWINLAYSKNWTHWCLCFLDIVCETAAQYLIKLGSN